MINAHMRLDRIVEGAAETLEREFASAQEAVEQVAAYAESRGFRMTYGGVRASVERSWPEPDGRDIGPMTPMGAAEAEDPG